MSFRTQAVWLDAVCARILAEKPLAEKSLSLMIGAHVEL